MAVTMERLYKDSTRRYQMKLIAGTQGLGNLVQWVHIIEDDEVNRFLHGGELVFTAGIRSQRPHWVLEYAHGLHEAGASAFVINIGPYIDEVPQEVIDYCDEIGLPLFTIPWRTRMVDMTRDFCEKIFHSEAIRESVAGTLKNILFQVGDQEAQILQMERYGYLRDSTYCFICVTMKESEPSNRVKLLEKLERDAEQAASSLREQLIRFRYQEQIILALADYTGQEIEAFAECFLEKISFGREKAPVCMGIGTNAKGFGSLPLSFDSAFQAGRIAARSGRSVVCYDRLGLQKILLQIKDPAILREYYDELVGKVEKYDTANGTYLTDFLISYMEHNGSPGQVAESSFIHRNTVTNNLRKIEKLTGCNMQLFENRVKCAIGLFVRDMQ